MKVVLAIAVVLALAIGANATAMMNGMVTTNTIAVQATAADKITATGWGIVLISHSTTYQGDDNLNPVQAIFNATWTGGATALPTDAAVYPVAYISYSTAPAVFDNGACTVGTNMDGPFGGRRDNTGNFLTYTANDYPYFTAAQTGVTATITLMYAGSSVASTTFTFDVVAPVWTKPSGTSPTVSAFSVLASRNNVQYAGANVTIANAAAGSYSVQLVYVSNTGNQGVAWSHACGITVAVGANTGSCMDSDFGKLYAYIGSWCGNTFSGSPATSIVFTNADTLTLKSVTVSANDQGYTNSFAGSAAPFNSAQMTIASTGNADVTPPTCTGATFTATGPISTGASATTTPTSLVCTDETSGSGLYVIGGFARANGGSVTVDYPFGGASTSTTPSVTVPAHYDGSISIIGVWAMDLQGNAAVYGTSGSYACPQTICGGGGSSSSSAVVASISLVIALILAVLAL